MTKHSSSFQRNILSITLICFTLLRSCWARNYFSNLDLSSQTLDQGVTGFTIQKNTGNSLGSSVSTAGDINKDGYDDIIVSDYPKNTVYVIYGGEKSSMSNIDLSITTLDPLKTGFIIAGITGDSFGYSVSTAGDINNDGYDDIIIGAPNKNSIQGAAYVIYGGEKSSMSNIDLSTQTLAPLTTGFKITGYAINNALGWSVSTAGDIDNDGFDEIVVGAYRLSAAYVIYGGLKSAMSDIVLSSTTLDPTSTGFVISGSGSNDALGVSVSAAGDTNKDGYDDIIVGAPYKSSAQGAAYVIYGRAKSSMSNIYLSSTTLNPLTTGFMITGNVAGDYLGWPVSTAGDINKDGYDDIIVGAFYINSYQGRAYVIYGGDKSSMSNIILSSQTLNPLITGFMITGSAVGDNLGRSMGLAGDVNNDGYDDIIVGAQGKNSNTGAAYVIYGGPKSSMSNWDFSSGATLNPLTTGFMIKGNAVGDYFGNSVGTAGDINKDGYDDIIVGASGKNTAYVIYASCSVNCKQCSSTESVCTQCKNPYLLYQGECFASCPDATIATSSTLCEDCPIHCSKCSSTSICTECKRSYILYQSQCLDSCPDGMFFSTTTSTCEDCISPCSKCTSLIACTECLSPLILYTSGCLPSCPISMFNSDNICKNCPSRCSSCASQDFCQVCDQDYTLSKSSSLCVSSRAQDKATRAIASATQGIGSVICVGSAVFPFSALVSRIVQNTRYLNLSVTTELAEVYQTWQTDLISWDVPNLMSNLDHFETSPSLFSQYDIGSPFLVNFWPTLINIIIGFGTFFACILLKKLFEHENYKGWAYSLVLKLVAGSFNFALIQAYACLDDILFYLVLDAKTNPFNSFFSWTSMICAVLFLVLGCLQVFFNFWTVYRYQKIKTQGTKETEAFNERNKYWALFYSDFNDDNLWSQAFFAIAILRSSLSSFIITILYDYPLMQTSFFLMMDAAIISFLYFEAPFSTLRATLAQYYYEIITLLVHLCAFIMALQDSFDASSDTVRLIMSTGILYLNTALISGAIGFMFIEIYKTISEKKRAARLKKRQTFPEDNQETQNLTQTVSPFHPSETAAQERDHWIFREQSDSIKPENSHNFEDNIEPSSQGPESNFDVESSILPDMNPSHRRNQSRRPIGIRYQPRTISQIQQINNLTNSINYE